MLKGSLVNLRYKSIADMGILADYLNKEHVMEVRAYELPHFAYKEQLEKEHKKKFEGHNHDNLNMVIETIDGKVIGEIGTEFIFWKNNLAFMYQYIGDEDYLTGGYREEAIKLFSEFALTEANIRKLKAGVQENDTLSLEALKANGFEVEVVHKEDIFIHGKYVDFYDLCKFRD